jgi:hypothetical protein
LGTNASFARSPLLELGMETTNESIEQLEIVRDLIEEHRSRLSVSLLDTMASVAKARKLLLKYKLIRSGLKIAHGLAEGESE